MTTFPNKAGHFLEIDQRQSWNSTTIPDGLLVWLEQFQPALPSARAFTAAQTRQSVKMAGVAFYKINAPSVSEISRWCVQLVYLSTSVPEPHSDERETPTPTPASDQPENAPSHPTRRSMSASSSGLKK